MLGSCDLDHILYPPDPAAFYLSHSELSNLLLVFVSANFRTLPTPSPQVGYSDSQLSIGPQCVFTSRYAAGRHLGQLNDVIQPLSLSEEIKEAKETKLPSKERQRCEERAEHQVS